MPGLPDAFASLHAHLRRPLLVVLSGPSGSGKSTLLRRFLGRHADFVPSVSATTRSPRPGEVEGRDYFFLDAATFAARVARDEFLEHATVFGRDRYGTPRAFVEERLAAAQSVIMDIDVQGAAQLRKRHPDAVLIFVVPPSAAVLTARLRDRGTEDPAAVARRLAAAVDELACWREFDYLLVNDGLDAADTTLDALVAAARATAGGRG